MTTSRRPDHTVVILHGELDIATAPVLREHLAAVLRPGSGLLVLHLGGMTFCGAAGLMVFAGAQHRAVSLGVTMRLAAPRPQAVKLLRLTGLDRGLVVHRSLNDALAPPPGRLTGHASTGRPYRHDRSSTR